VTKVYYEPGDGSQKQPPGSFPYTRGLYPDMYGHRLWTMRQYSGYASAAQTNQRFRYLLSQGQTGLSTAFDLPTQMGFDSDSPRALGEVGRVGVAVDTLADMEELFEGIALDTVSTSMTINSTAACLLLMYQIVAENHGIPSSALNGTVQNDVLKEYAARGTYIYPPQHSMRLVTDLMAYAQAEMPLWNTISISGYHIREAGSSAVQEVGFTLSNAIAYVQAALDAGLDVDAFAPRLSFFFNVHNDVLEEIAKFRAARQLWSTIMRDRFGAMNERSRMLRFHAQTAGSTLTAQQPLNNVVRVSLQALAAVLGGAQSLHTNGYDEALALPTQDAATLALRTQQIIAHESGVTRASDPLGGAYMLEHLTDDLASSAQKLIDEVDRRGGSVAVIQDGWMQREIEDAAYRWQQSVDQGRVVVVGMNRFVQDSSERIDILEADPAVEANQVERLQSVRRQRDGEAVESALQALRTAAKGSTNLLYPMKSALAAYATIGEVSDALRSIFGEYHPSY
jgi:methylmalonyl-CoA mutase N-terminal domain/subunit